MYARIPELLEQGMTKTEIAAMYRVTPGTLAVFCSQRCISLRIGGRLPSRTKLVPQGKPLSLTLSEDVLQSLRKAARSMGKGSIARLASELLEKIVSDNLYKAVLDEDGERASSVAATSAIKAPRPTNGAPHIAHRRVL